MTSDPPTLDLTRSPPSPATGDPTVPMRLQELHPALVHFPLALLPTAIAADALGRATGSEKLSELGRTLMPIAATSAAVAGVAGLIAQQTVELDDHTTDMVITHRNINLGLVGVAALMARSRVKQEKPGLGYLLLGLAGIGAMTYSAYLGGHMVYNHGVGVEKAGGLNEEQAPELRADNLGEVARVAGRHISEGTKVTVDEFRQGKIAPVLTDRPHSGNGEPEQPRLAW